MFANMKPRAPRSTLGSDGGDAAAARGGGSGAAHDAAGGVRSHSSGGCTSALRSAEATLADMVVVEALDRDVFRGCNLWKPVAGRAVFGGQVVAQACAACCATVSLAEYALHSVHSYFCLPGDPTTPILYLVSPTRDGKSYVTRSCTAVQRGKTIFVAMASFHRLDEPSAVEHAYTMPPAPDPEGIPDTTARLKAVLADARLPDMFRSRVEAQLAEDTPIDLRYCRRSDPLAPASDAPTQLLWLRSKTPVSADAGLPLHAARALHACAIAFASDYSLLGNALLPHGSPNPAVSFMSSLDHAMWFHTAARADAWLLYELESPRLLHGRGFSLGRLFRRDGVLAVSTAQEGVIRFHADFASEPPLAIHRGPFGGAPGGWSVEEAAAPSLAAGGSGSGGGGGSAGGGSAGGGSTGGGSAGGAAAASAPPGAAAQGIANHPLATWGSTHPAEPSPPTPSGAAFRARL